MDYNSYAEHVVAPMLAHLTDDYKELPQVMQVVRDLVARGLTDEELTVLLVPTAALAVDVRRQVEAEAEVERAKKAEQAEARAKVLLTQVDVEKSKAEGRLVVTPVDGDDTWAPKTKAKDGTVEVLAAWQANGRGGEKARFRLN